VVAGTLEAEIRSGTPGSVSLDYYDSSGNYSHTDTGKGTGVTIQVNIREHDTLSENDIVLSGYQKLNLPFVKNVQRMISKNTLYKGRFKLLYEVPFSKVEEKLGTFDTAKLMVEIVVPERTGAEKDSTDEETVFTDSDGWRDGDQKDSQEFFDGLEK